MRLRTAVAASSSPMRYRSCPAASAERGQCANPNALGVSRTVEIDTTGGPGFGFEQYKAYDFLLLKEVVLTFDDGRGRTTPGGARRARRHASRRRSSPSARWPLACPRSCATSPGRPHLGAHTWSHIEIGKKLKDEARLEGRDREGHQRRASAPWAGRSAPFFRYPEPARTPRS